MMTLLKKNGEAILQHPLHRACELTLVKHSEGTAQLTFMVNEFSVNPQGFLHGGIVYALSDAAAYMAVASVLPEDATPVTMDMNCSVLRPASKSALVTLDAKVERCGKQVAFMDVTALVEHKGQTVMIAHARITKHVTRA